MTAVEVSTQQQQQVTSAFHMMPTQWFSTVEDQAFQLATGNSIQHDAFIHAGTHPSTHGLLANNIKSSLDYFDKYAKDMQSSWTDPVKAISELNKVEHTTPPVLSPEEQSLLLQQSGLLGGTSDNSILDQQCNYAAQNKYPPSWQLGANPNASFVDSSERSLSSFVDHHLGQHIVAI